MRHWKPCKRILYVKSYCFFEIIAWRFKNYKLTWVISFAYEFFPVLSTINNIFIYKYIYIYIYIYKYKEYGKAIGYVSLDNNCFEFSIYFRVCDDMINCSSCVPCNTCWFISVGKRLFRNIKFTKLWTILLSLKSSLQPRPICCW